MTPSELKANVEDTGNCFFSRDSMRFFGDKMANYGVCSAVVDTWTDKAVKVWELYRKRAVKGGLTSSAYFDKLTFKRIHPRG